MKPCPYTHASLDDALDCHWCQGNAQEALARRRAAGAEKAIVRQPLPTAPEEAPPVVDQVIADLRARSEQGKKKYGQELRPFNGRDALVDAYQEALDLAVYLRQAIEERDA